MFAVLRPVVPGESHSHEISAVNALLALNSKSSCSTPPGLVPDSTPTSSAVRTFSEDHSPPDLISALRMSTSAYPPEAIAHYEAARSGTCLQDYPPDVKTHHPQCPTTLAMIHPPWSALALNAPLDQSQGTRPPASLAIISARSVARVMPAHPPSRRT